MIPLSSATRVFVVTGATDMRKGFDGLYGIVANRLGMDPTSGHLFVFCNAARTRIKVLTWDGSGHRVGVFGFATNVLNKADSAGTGTLRRPPPRSLTSSSRCCWAAWI